jgi:hypothetical protein
LQEGTHGHHPAVGCNSSTRWLEDARQIEHAFVIFLSRGNVSSRQPIDASNRW